MSEARILTDDELRRLEALQVTPGSWRVLFGVDVTSAEDDADAGDLAVADCGAPSMLTPEEQRQNAQLIAAAPWWRWHEGLRTRCGHRVSSTEDGVWTLQRQRRSNTWHEVRLQDPTPDPADPLLPGWLLHLLRERTGPGTHAHPDVVAGGGWDVWVDRAEPGSPAVWRCIGSGDTEIDALLAALQGLSS